MEKKKIDEAKKLFAQLSPEAQKRIIELIRNVLREDKSHKA